MSASNVLTQTLPSGRQLSVNSLSIPGGVLYLSSIEGSARQSETASSVFVSTAVPSPIRYLPLTGARSDAGAAVTATAGSGTVGVARTAGASLQLVGEATSASGVTDKALWELDLPDTYVAGASIPVTVNAVVTGSGTLTTAATTMTMAVYTEINGVESALTVTGAVQFGKTASNLGFTITGTGLVPGSHLVIELTMLVTTSLLSCTGYVNSVGYQA